MGLPTAKHNTWLDSGFFGIIFFEGPAPKNIIPKNPRRWEIFGGFRGKWPKHVSGRKTATCSFGKMPKNAIDLLVGKNLVKQTLCRNAVFRAPQTTKKSTQRQKTENRKPENPPKLLWICLLGKKLANRVCAKMLFLEHPKMPKNGPDIKKLKIQKLKTPQNAMNLLVEKIMQTKCVQKSAVFKASPDQ